MPLLISVNKILSAIHTHLFLSINSFRIFGIKFRSYDFLFCLGDLNFRLIDFLANIFPGIDFQPFVVNPGIDRHVHHNYVCRNINISSYQFFPGVCQCHLLLTQNVWFTKKIWGVGGRGYFLESTLSDHIIYLFLQFVEGTFFFVCTSSNVTSDTNQLPPTRR